jgi:hypothetical protein
MTGKEIADAMRRQIRIVGDSNNYIDGFAGDPNLISLEADGKLSLAQAINAFLRDLAMRFQYNVTTTNIALVAGTSTYAVPSNVIEILRASHSGLQLKQTNNNDLGRREPSWQSKVGRATHFILQGSTSIEVYPKPDAAAVGLGALILITSTTPTPLVNTTDVPANIPEVLQEQMLVMGAVRWLLKSDVASAHNQERAKQLTEEMPLYEKQFADYINRTHNVDEGRYREVYQEVISVPAQGIPSAISPGSGK